MVSITGATREYDVDSFGSDVSFLERHTALVVLESKDGKARVAVAPGYQARVMSSTAGGSEGASYGYVHRPGIAARARQPHITVLGGEDRFWLGPEGGQFGLYFAPGAPFDVAHWQVPEPLDWGAWPITAQNPCEVTCAQSMALTNRAGTQFAVDVRRTIRLIAAEELGVALGANVRAVAYESDNQITNAGDEPWQRATGLLSIWILGMFKPGPRATVVVPFVPGSERERGKIVNDDYFGAIPPDRLRVTDRAIFFLGDGASRGKIGVSKARARDVLGSYDPDTRTLTYVQYTLPAHETDYLCSMWEEQREPYAGDVVNSYNDGPNAAGSAPLGPFYELETSSPAAALARGESLRHVHRTVHLEGPERELDTVAQAVLGLTLDEIANAFKR